MKISLHRLVFFIIFCTSISVSVQIGVGNRVPHPDALMEVSSTTKGLLLPRVSLIASTSASPYVWTCSWNGGV